MNPSRCSTPLTQEILTDYWLAALSPTDEERVEEHFLGCEHCSAELQKLRGLVEGIRDLTRKGLLQVIVSGPFLERLRGDGLNIRQYHVEPGGAVACTITDKDDLVIGRLAADLTRAGRVDISRCDAQGREHARLRDIPLTRDGNEVVFSESTDLLRSLGEETLRLRLIAVDEEQERVLGEYTFNHSPTR